MQDGLGLVGHQIEDVSHHLKDMSIVSSDESDWERSANEAGTRVLRSRTLKWRNGVLQHILKELDTKSKIRLLEKGHTLTNRVVGEHLSLRQPPAELPKWMLNTCYVNK